MLLEVHDSLLFEVPDSLIDDHAKVIKTVMESAPVVALDWRDIPFEVDIQKGLNWGYMEEINVNTNTAPLKEQMTLS